MLPSILAKEIIKGLQAYVVTGFETPTPFFKGIFSDLVKTPGRFYKGPYLGLQLPFQSGEAGKDFGDYVQSSAAFSCFSVHGGV